MNQEYEPNQSFQQMYQQDYRPIWEKPQTVRPQERLWKQRHPALNVIIAVVALVLGWGGMQLALHRLDHKQQAIGNAAVAPMQSVVPIASPNAAAVQRWQVESGAAGLWLTVSKAGYAMQTAANNHDDAGIEASCRTLGQASDALGRLLPTPDAELTADYADFVANAHAGVAYCVAGDFDKDQVPLSKAATAAVKALSRLRAVTGS